MKKIVILGAGRVGRIIARDLAEDTSFEITAADFSKDNLGLLRNKTKAKTCVADLSDPEKLRTIIEKSDLVVGALPGALGFGAMQAVIDAQKPYVDISFMPEDPRILDARAKSAGIPVVYDFGVAPGMSNLLIAKSVRELKKARQILYIVGGLPIVRQLPWEYEAPFSPRDVIEEYVRPARYKSDGFVRIRPALSDIENFDIPEIGTLEGFLTDGLRSLLDTIDCPNIVEKTLRYPGHAARIQLLKDAGFLDNKNIEVNGHPVTVREFTFKLLEPAWEQSKDSREFTAMQIFVMGDGESGDKKIVWRLLDHTDEKRGESSMARTTGFPAALAARYMLDGTASLEPGIHPPESLAENDALVEKILADLTRRSVRYERMDTLSPVRNVAGQQITSETV